MQKVVGYIETLVPLDQKHARDDEPDRQSEDAEEAGERSVRASVTGPADTMA